MSGRGWHLDRWVTPDDLENLMANGVCRWTMRGRGTVLEGLSHEEARLIEGAPALLLAARQTVDSYLRGDLGMLGQRTMAARAMLSLVRAVKRAETRGRK